MKPVLDKNGGLAKSHHECWETPLDAAVRGYP
jgi:hypothetical protein